MVIKNIFEKYITKTGLFKYIENVTSITENFQIKTHNFHISAQNIHFGMVLTSTHNLRFLSKNKKHNVYPVNLSFTI